MSETDERQESAGHAVAPSVMTESSAVVGGSALRRSATMIACLLGVALFALALVGPRATYPGPEMDEGSVLAYADRVLEGAVPHRDFSTFYGPGNVWLVAGAFAMLERSIWVERAVGVAYRLLIVLSMAVICWRLAGLPAAVVGGGISATVFPNEVPWAYATYGAIAFGLVSVALLAKAATTRRPSQALVLAAGVAGGVGVLMRFDFTLAILAAAVPLVLILERRAGAMFWIGLVASAGLYIPYLLIVGPTRIGQTIGDIRASGAGRDLSLPRPWMEWGDLLAAVLVLTPLLLIVGAVLVRRNTRDGRARIILSVGLFSTGLVPWVLSRPDITHIAPAALVPLSVVPAVTLALIGSVHWSERTKRLVSGALVTVAMIGVFWKSESHLRLAPGKVENRGREFFPIGQRSIPDATAIVRELELRSRPGESLYVGPQDLRRMNNGATYLYFVLPQLEPASYYMEMNPFTTTRDGSGFAADLRAADWLILTSQWDDWKEANDSILYGPSDANRLVRERFCERLTSGEYRLYERCKRRVGPATTG